MKKTASKKVVSQTVSFGQWVNEIARARGEVGQFVLDLRARKDITAKTPLKTAAAKLGAIAEFRILEARYNGFLKRGSQAKKAA